MRLIDKLIAPPSTGYSLLPAIFLNKGGFSLKNLVSPKTKKAVTFVVENEFVRILGVNEKLEKLFPPFEKDYSEEGNIELQLQDVSDFLKENFQNFKEISIGTYLPTRYGILRLYTFPRSLKKRELLNSIELYIQEEIAEVFPDKEVVYSFDILDTGPEEPYKVVVAILDKEVVDLLVNWSMELNINLEILSFEPICVINFGLLKQLPQPFSIIYTEKNKILVVSYGKTKINYETFPYSLSLESGFEEALNMLIWDIRNYIVLNDLSNIFLGGIVLEYNHLTEFFLERLPIFGLLSIDKFPERYSLLYTLGVRLLNA